MSIIWNSTALRRTYLVFKMYRFVIYFHFSLLTTTK
ncbi:unnamed protein product [Tenebrio molitor]|nr:unnamed protein product [Tenebrio molitor]